ncbi:PQQ-dependent sugar dehydrogenase [Adhaeribacter sp. BT258]|uniref:PQQ-dependent sugar dehydrogenase n=1 Tax=Adhaeribacter terrigena TaxID=2793070 RepID=A0ABS1C3U6_9BACT|nr:PQQ-dependent sugar dehydrogenase [Adhaeribacter terrigena]MBK0404071.1 PQQ-dependent sugar dehydrogenase [Adhaeribacter terrigena]
MERKLRAKLSWLVWMICLLPFSACDSDDDTTDNPVNKVLQLREMNGTFVSPIALVESPDETNRLFVVDQAGKVFIINAAGNVVTDPFLDVTAKMVPLTPQYDERGLLGFDFHPNYKTNGKFYVYYSAPLKAGAPAGWNHTSMISEFTVSADPNKANAGSERMIMEIHKPQANHNGGTIAFGKDGFLYISIGDGGGANDVGLGHVLDWYTVNDGGNAQSVDNLLGKILRIDVNSGSPYGIPAGNPLVGKPGMDEIYAMGLRNPYRFSFDRTTGELFVGDAGQNLYEEVNKVTIGGNYGWNVKEASHCFSTATPNQSLASCPSSDPDGRQLVDPIIEFQNIKSFAGGLGLVVVGGNVYRGSAVPRLQGKYLFSNFTASQTSPSGDIYMASPGGTTWPYEKISFSNATAPGIGYYVKGFGEDNKGELYVLATKELGPTGNTGKVLKIVEE